MTVEESIRFLEAEWERDTGFLGRIRSGEFDSTEAADFMGRLNEISIDEGPQINRRFVSLTWFLPLFLSWQRERITETGGDLEAYDRFRTQVETLLLEKLLGVP